MLKLQDPRSIELSGSTQQALSQVSEAMEKINERRPFENEVSAKLRDALLPDRIVASLNMEGIVATRRQTIAVMDAMRIQEVIGKSEVEIFNTLKADEFVQTSVDDACPLDERMIRNVNHLLLDGIRHDAGTFRAGTVELPGAPIQPPPPGDVPDLVRELVELLPLGESLHPLVQAAWLHAQFTQIHPFSDGNGRGGRLLQDWSLIRRGYFPVGIPPSQRDDYYEALEGADKGEWDDLVELLAVLQLSMLSKIEALVVEAEQRKSFIAKLASAAATREKNTKHKSYLLWRKRMELISRSMQEACKELDAVAGSVGANYRDYGVIDFREWENICRYGHIDRSWLFSILFFAEGKPLYKTIGYLKRHTSLPSVDHFNAPRDAVALYFTGAEAKEQTKPNFANYADPHIRLREILFFDDEAYLYTQPSADKPWVIQDLATNNQVVEQLFMDVFARKAGLDVG